MTRAETYRVEIIALPDFPLIKPGDDLAAAIIACLQAAGLVPESGDIFVIAQKVVSIAEDALVDLQDVTPGKRALEIARETGKDPRLVELILQESEEISRMKRGTLIVRHRLGFTSANAGIDRSNVEQLGTGEVVVKIPADPDASAASLRQRLMAQLGIQLGVVIIDSHGRPFRLGTVGVAIGVAGVPALWDRRGDHDLYGYELKHTEVGTADEIAAAASLLMGQADEGTPVVIIRGLRLPAVAGTARDLVRPKELDLYRASG